MRLRDNERDNPFKEFSFKGEQMMEELRGWVEEEKNSEVGEMLIYLYGSENDPSEIKKLLWLIKRKEDYIGDALSRCTNRESGM